MGKPHWFPFYVNDFLSSSKVTLMSNEERGGYILLLCHEWNDPHCTLPDNDEAIRKLSQLMGDLTLVKSCFIRKRGRLLNERLYTEWIKTKEKSDLARKSIAIRWKNERNTNVLPTQYSSQSQSQSQSQSEKEKEKIILPLKNGHAKGKRAINEFDCITEKHRLFAQQIGIDPGPEWGKFKNYCLAHDKRYANFEAAFRNWLANAKEMKGARV